MYQLSPTDAQMLFFESDPTPNQVSLVLIFDQSSAPRGNVRFKQIMQRMEDALEHAPNFRCRLLRVPLNIDDPWWIPDPRFDIEFHVRHMALPKPGDWRQLCIQIARLISRTLDPSRPLWEMHVIEGLDKIKGLPPGCFAIVLKMHHAMIDGKGTMALLSAMLDREPNPRRRKPPRGGKSSSTARLPSNWWLTSKALRRLVNRPGQLLRLVARAAPIMIRTQMRSAKPSVVAKRVPYTPLNGTVTAARVFDARFYDLDTVKRIRALAPGSTVNDVVLALASGALRRYLRAKDALPEDTLVASVPIAVRTEETAGKASGNELFVRMVPLCTHIEDPVERLRAICEVMTSTKSYVNAVGARTMLDVNSALPGALVGTMAQAAFSIARMRGRATVANTVVTNVPGMQQPMYLCGAKLLKITGHAPPIGTIGLTNAIGSYCGELSFCAAACRDLMPDPEFYMQCVDESFSEYAQLAKRLRVPKQPAAPGRAAPTPESVPRKRAVAGSHTAGRKRTAPRPEKRPGRKQVARRAKSTRRSNA